MWLCLLLWYALVYAECANGKHANERSKFSDTALPLAYTTNKLSKVNRESENNHVSLTAATGLSNGETEHFHNFNKLNKSIPIVVLDEDESKSRIGYEKDLMLVLPVNTNTNGSDLEMWYTQTPVTAIVEDRTTKLEHRADYDVYEDQKTDDDRHPYTNFLINKSKSKPQKSPLDYGYPESFKFVEDLNGLPSNHKPEWASTDVIDLEEASTKIKATTELVSSTRNNPFEMFESVKPLEINKLLALQQMIQTSSESEEYTTEKKDLTESHIHTVPKRPSKWPTKKPQKTKLTTEATTTENTPQVNTSAPIYPMGSDQLYTAVRYTTLLSQSTNEFLPTSHPHKNRPILMPHSNHYQPTPTTTTTITTTTTTTTTERPTSPKPRPTITITSEAITATKRPTTTTTTTTTTTSLPSTSTTSTTTPSSISDILVYNVTEDVDDEFPSSINSFNSTGTQNLSDFQIEDFQPLKDFNSFKIDKKPDEIEPLKDVALPISSDMLTNDMKSMLVSLGILKFEDIKPSSTTTEKVIVRTELVTPNIDPNSYTSFKKIPTDYKQQPDRATISDDMKDLLASFGLLPRKTSQNETSGTRISRQQNLTEVANVTNLEMQTDLPTNFTEEIDSETQTNLPNFLRANSSQVGSELEADEASFFNSDNPTYDSDKPIDINSDMLTDEMKNTLENLGFLKQSQLTNRSPKSAHVFQPTSQLEELNKDDNVKKITDVLRTIKNLSIKTETNDISAEELEKQLQNLTATLDNENFADVNETLLFELNEILSNDTNIKIIESIENMTKKMESNKTSTTTETITSASNDFPITSLVQPQMKPPNPLSTDELLQLYEMGKNEIKRQQPSSASASTSTTSEQPSSTFPSSIDDTSMPGTNTETFISNTEVTNINIETSSATSITSTSTTTSEVPTDAKVSANNNAPVADLADSFGGAEVASEEPSADDLPTPKPNGLYFFLDWNTFLNVGEEDKNPVRIRFAPRAGNARNFLPITVP